MKKSYTPCSGCGIGEGAPAMQFVGPCLYVHAKGSCYLCGRCENLVDTEMHIEGEGALAICRACIHDMAHTAGLVVNAQDEIEGLRQELDALEVERDNAVLRAEEAEASLADVREQWVAAVEAHERGER